MKRRFMVMCVIASLAVGLGWQATASAHEKHYGPNGAVITTSSSTVDPGHSVTVNCRNFAPNESITLTLNGVFLGKTHSDNHGSCSIRVTIPSNTTGGVHTILATGATGDSASTQITVVIPHPKHHRQSSHHKTHHWWDFLF